MVAQGMFAVMFCLTYAGRRLKLDITRNILSSTYWFGLTRSLLAVGQGANGIHRSRVGPDKGICGQNTSPLSRIIKVR